MKRWWFVIIISVSFILTSCSSSEKSNSEGYGIESDDQTTMDTSPEMSGYVMDQEKDRILVVAPLEDDSEGGARAMWVSGVSNDPWLGKQVEVWVKGNIKESYPEQAEADNVVTLELSDVEGADLKASEALAKALTDTSSEEGVLSVKMISFDIDADEWMVELSKVGTGRGDVERVIADHR